MMGNPCMLLLFHMAILTSNFASAEHRGMTAVTVTRAETSPESSIASSHGISQRTRACDLTLQLVSWPSETGTADEIQFPDRLTSLLRNSPAFTHRPELVRQVPNAEYDAANVVALVRGRGRRCVVLAGHFDTVSVANFGALAPLARSPFALRDALIDELSNRPRSGAEEQALADLVSTAFPPGRGVLDMKSGLAAGICALERHAAAADPVGSILLVATPDEENRSRGMRGLRDRLPDLAREWNLDIVAGINLDAVSDLGDGSDGRSIHLGTVGKLLPFAFVVGRATHAGYPFEGVSAHLVAAEILRDIECNTALCDEHLGERAPPPVCLEYKDLRTGYDVTTPDRVWLAFNWLTHRRAPQDILSTFKGIVEAAAARALERVAAAAESFFGAEPPSHSAVVITLAELKSRAISTGGEAAARRHEQRIAALDREGDPLVASRALVDGLVADAGLAGPAVVVGFGSLRYPHTHLDRARAADRRLERCAMRAAASIGAQHGVAVKARGFFSGISDMSFLGRRPDVHEDAFVAANTVMPAAIDHAPDTALEFPTINIGPWGRHYHQKLERLHAGYAFEILPDLVFETAAAILADGSADDARVGEVRSSVPA